MHLRFSAGFSVFTKISWKMCHIFQFIKFSLLGNEISVLLLALGDRLECENGCVWTLQLGITKKNRLIPQEERKKVKPTNLLFPLIIPNKITKKMWRTTWLVLPRCFVKSVALLPHISRNEFVLISEFAHLPEEPPNPALALSLLY